MHGKPCLHIVRVIGGYIPKPVPLKQCVRGTEQKRPLTDLPWVKQGYAVSSRETAEDPVLSVAI